MIDILGLVLEKAVTWGVDKIIEVAASCDSCGQKWHQRIGNAASNHFGCTNCHKQVVQFTNACNTTVGRNGEIGHTAAQLLRNYQVGEDPADKSWILKDKYPHYLFVPFIARARALPNTDIVITGSLSDYETGQVFGQQQQILLPTHYDSAWNEEQKQRVFFNWAEIPNHMRLKGKIFAVDTALKSRYGDVLHNDRILINLFG